MPKNYRIKYTYSARDDILRMRKYILQTFKYHELAKGFTNRIQKAARELKILPNGYSTIGFQYRGYDIYLKPYRTYLLFYTIDEDAGIVTILRVLKDGMNWQYILKRWLIENG
ncbi:MAG: type II toxin-antitoxin system RelE/ParE family toxin [Lachnospiraceae bacterium]|nr:type II toxin-antitoxin system RelE/ParE family toxin [Lachnospiraceae bacterium]